ncbi:hypothetical protein [Antrihabitans stalactiti]|uniref:DUF4386 domain-containing protein n=1 Tax=Antrihabitans stalactiti TaxID=2584121 RepID=A0A848K7G2_9NOCA|nr:hypothetical protein [Antrihabitans stalactiti]NMN94723.1 hypothetical protein [Antrihabitans stalactiti]
MSTRTLEPVSHLQDQPTSSLWRIPPIPAIIGILDRWAQTGRLQRLSYLVFGGTAVLAVAGLLTLYVTILPDGESTTAIADFIRDHQLLLKVAMGLAGLMFLALLVISGAVASLLYPADKSPGHRMSWIGFASDLALIIFFAFEVGIFAANILLVDHVSDEIVHALHVVTLASAYLLGPLWIPFFISFIVISKRGNVFPSWLNWFAAYTCVTNGLAWFGFLTLTGPLNAMNGLVSLGGPTIGPVPFIVILAVHLVMRELPAGLARRNAQLTGGATQ